MSEFEFMDEVPVVEPENEDVSGSELPPILREIERVAGFESAMKLVKKLGGISVTIPKEPEHGHALCKAVGLETAQKIAALFGGERIAVPRAHHYHTVRRQAEVCRRYREGETVRSLAREFHVTERAIEKMVQRENLRRQRRKYEKMMGRS